MHTQGRAEDVVSVLQDQTKVPAGTQVLYAQGRAQSTTTSQSRLFAAAVAAARQAKVGRAGAPASVAT